MKPPNESDAPPGSEHADEAKTTAKVAHVSKQVTPRTKKPQPGAKRRHPLGSTTATRPLIGSATEAPSNIPGVPPNDSATFNRPGVSDSFLTAAGCAHVDENDCARLYGFNAVGIAIPFRTLNGSPVVDGGCAFARVRLSHATDDQKYSQRSGSGVHVYVPPGFAILPKGAALFLVEGEFKAAALAEAGHAAIGLCGITGAIRTISDVDSTRRYEINEELAVLLEAQQPARVVFLGDGDVALNAQFAVEAAKLRKVVCGDKRFAFVQNVLAAKVAIDGPKGIDDCRGTWGDGFAAWFDKLLADSFDVPAKATAVEIFADLLRREAKGMKRFLAGSGHEAYRARLRLLQSAAQLWNEPVAPLELKPLLADALGVGKSEVAGLVRDAASNRKARTRKNRKANRGERIRPGQNRHASATPSQWFAEKFPSLADEFGDAILEETDKDGIVSARDIGEDFLAATLGDKGSAAAPTVFLPTEEKFYIYSPADGVFVHKREPILLARLSRLLLACARSCDEGCEIRALEFRFRDAAALTGVLRKARGLLEVPHDFFSSDLTKFIPCANGMLRLSDKTPLPFSPSYRRRNKLAVPYDPAAKCPLFLDTLMRVALDPDDLDLLQRWCGLALIGENQAQKIVILSGTAGGGKGTFVRVLNGIIGPMNLASLRPQLLGERFELGRFLGKTLLYGADVPANFLNQCGASVLKSLTGYDPVTLEFKNSNESPFIICRFNVIVTCNSRLTVNLEGDVEAWRRRLAIIDYHKPKPERVIADLDQRILATEGPGVLNWMLEGLNKLRADAWQLHLTGQQQAAVDNLLLESDGYTVFVREELMRADGEQLTAQDAFAAYVEFCNRREWAALTRNKFGHVIGDVVARVYGFTSRNDILDTNGKAQRGWAGLSLREKNARRTAKKASEASESMVADGSETLFPVQPAKIPANETALVL